MGELAEPCPLSHPAISQHLDVLERAGLVQRIPSGRQNRCRRTGAPLGVGADWILAYARYWTEAFDRAGPDPITASGEAIDWHEMVTCFAAAEELRESVTQGRFRSGRRDRPQHPSVRVV